MPFCTTTGALECHHKPHAHGCANHFQNEEQSFSQKISKHANSTFHHGSLKLISSKTALITKLLSDQLADPDW
jgi:hypothetical protein